jgi:integrase
MQGYTKPVNRLIRLSEDRAEMLGRLPRLGDLLDQVSIRAAVMSKATANLELAALRAVLREARHDGSQVRWPEGIDARDWMTLASPQDLDAISTASHRPYKDIFDEGGEIMKAEREAAENRGMSQSGEELADLLAGKEGPAQDRKNQKNQPHLSWRDLMHFELELSDQDPREAIHAIMNKTGKVPTEGLLRLFSNVIWLTGMRPTEVWTCRLMAPRPDIDFTPEQSRLVRKDPTQALIQGLMIQVERLEGAVTEGYGRAASLAMEKADAPCLLMIKSAKQTNANPLLKAAQRLQVLDAIPIRHLGMIAMASQLRHLKVDEKTQDGYRASMTRILKMIAKRDARLSALNLNLYSFRHSFATRVKLAMEPHEAAALTGHTSINTLYAYGERRATKGVSKSGGVAKKHGDWIPATDPIRAEALNLFWNERGRPSPTALQPDAN